MNCPPIDQGMDLVMARYFKWKKQNINKDIKEFIEYYNAEKKYTNLSQKQTIRIMTYFMNTVEMPPKE